MRLWKASVGHNRVMVNEGVWKTFNWQAVGVAINGRYATIWFGMLPDESDKKLLEHPEVLPQKQHLNTLTDG